MNISPLKIGLLAMGVVAVFQGSAQSIMTTQVPSFDKAKALEISKRTERIHNKPAITSTYRYHKRLASTHSGIAIELTASNFPLSRDYPIFKQFGNVYYDKLKQGGYSYLIKTNFKNWEAAEKFLSEIILPKAPEARVIEYKTGVRKTSKG